MRKSAHSLRQVASPSAGGRLNIRPMRLILVLLALTCSTCMFAPGMAGADVDMAGGLEKSAYSKVESLASSANGTYRCTDQYSVVANWYYYYAIGNCKAGWELEVVSYAPENGTTHEHSYGGFVNNAFSGCGWIDTRYPLEKLNGNEHSACAGSGSGREFKVEESTFMEKHNSGTVGDGNPVVNKVPCPEYANYRPWSSNNVEKELIRTAPEYAVSAPGSNYPALKWRYVTKYASTDSTGKYVMVRDDRIGEGEGNWVFVPRSCLPTTLPENGEERLPPAPSVTTNAASGIATPNATLNATINPHGVSTKYFFEYGTTESYGLYTSTENAGSGTGNVNVSTPVGGLAAGTKYYFRVVASSAIGESFGAAVSFTTQPPPEVSTEAASELQQVKAQLNGNVNPEGLDTHYDFEYGKTESYGSSTSLSDTGAGSSSLPVSAVVSGLEPDTTYHYRLIASSSAGSVGGSDHTFTTPYVLDAFYRGTTGGLQNTYWNGSYWSSGALGPENVMEGNPSAIALSEGKMDVFYRNKKGGLENAYWNGSAWSFSALGPENVMAGNPSAIALSEGKMDVFYRNKKGGLENAYWSGSAWSFSALGPENVMEGDPSAIALPEGKMDVFYRNKKGGLENAYWSGAWYFGALGPENVMAGNPSAIALSEGKMDVFYRNKKGGLENACWSGSAWSFSALGPENVMEGNPSAVALPEGKMDVFYRNKTSGLENAYWSGAWYFGALGSEKIMAGDPGGVALPNGVMDVFYRTTSGVLQNAFWNSSSWSFGAISSEKTVAGEISAVDVL